MINFPIQILVCSHFDCVSIWISEDAFIKKYISKVKINFIIYKDQNDFYFLKFRECTFFYALGFFLLEQRCKRTGFAPRFQWSKQKFNPIFWARDIDWIVLKSQYPNQTVKSQHVSINISSSENRIEFLFASLKLWHMIW